MVYVHFLTDNIFEEGTILEGLFLGGLVWGGGGV